MDDDRTAVRLTSRRRFLNPAKPVLQRKRKSEKRMDRKSLTMLEFDSVRDRLGRYASFSASAAMAEKLEPLTDADIILRNLQRTTEARRLLSINDTYQLGGCRDFRPALMTARKSGTLEAKTFVEISYTLAIARDVRNSLLYHEKEYPLLAEIADNLLPPTGLIERINRTVTERGDVLDSASEKLATIRREIRTGYSRLLDRLEKILHDPRHDGMIQEAIITQRNGRYVVPIKAEYKNRFKCIVHDQSASGVTLFVEPLATVELNNAYYELQLRERDEVQRILHELTVYIADFAEPLETVVEALADLDFVFMRAKYADALRANEPEIVPPQRGSNIPVIELYDARHPLLPADKVVPIDVAPEPGILSVVITGPNTGGKTVSLKTIGLMICMTQSGLHIPAQSGSKLSIFRDVFADIGDEQSIEQSLSTFSGHMTNIIRILNSANSKTLVLIDELGSGTDPEEGAALARAILQHMIQRRIPNFVATHFSDLKAYAHVTDGATNASMQFDLKTLQPTYRLLIGIPGRSNALLIAKRLGLAPEILAAAEETVAPEDKSGGALLDEINRLHDLARKARSAADRSRSLAENERRELQRKIEEIENEKERILSETYAEMQDELNALREETARLRRAYQNAKIPLDSIRELESEIKATTVEARHVERKIEKKAAQKSAILLENRPFKLGQKVRVRSLGTDTPAILSSLSDDEAEIQLGMLRMRVPVSDLRHLNQSDEDEAQATPEPVIPVPSEKVAVPVFRESPGIEIDLRGYNSEDVIPPLEKYLDDATLAGLPYVRIIHGKGTGKLRQVVRRFLIDMPQVKFIERGKDAEGGEGVTVAHLRS